MRPLIAAIALAGGLAASSTYAQAPEIIDLTPTMGAHQTLVRISGANLRKARIVWDAGEPSERLLMSNLQGADIFSVPAKTPSGNPTPAGDHWVAIQNEHGRSQRITFTVVNPNRPKPNPRLDDISLVNAKFEPSGLARFALYVQGANIDVGANVLINDVVHTSEAHKVLINKLFVSNPETLEYPINHYLSRAVHIETKPGKEVRVQIVNEGGELSNVRKYLLPNNLAELDSDGDGIPDMVEHGLDYHYGDNQEQVDVRALGADRFRKDIFVEVDIMKDLLSPPQPKVFEYARQMFAAAPLISPFGANGINLSIDPTGTVDAWDFLDTPRYPSGGDDSQDISIGKASFNALIDKFFTPAKRGLFHYAIWGAESDSQNTGYSRSNRDSDVGSAFHVTFDHLPFRTLALQATTFVHELGHNLGQRHGGGDYDNSESPNYWSVMSYTWSARTVKSDEYRRTYPTCTQIYYASPGAVEQDGAPPRHLGILLDYSEGMGPVGLIRGKLDENIGVCGQPIDWNGNGILGEREVTTPKPWCGPDLGTGCNPQGPASDYPNWPNLKYHGPCGSTQLGCLPRIELPGPDYLQLVQDDATLRKKLEDEPAVSVRSPAIISSGSTPLAEPSGEILKRKRIRRLVAGLERSRGIMPGTIKVGAITANSVALHHDWPKLLKLKERVPFSANIAIQYPVPDTTAELEYNVSVERERVQDLVGLKVGREIAMEAIQSDRSAISLKLAFGILTARQVDGAGPRIPVEVTVDSEKRELREGEVHRIGDLDVRVLASRNLTQEVGRLGLPYVLRLRATSAL